MSARRSNRLRRGCEAEGVATQALAVSHAFHSPLMEPMLAEFHQVARKVRFATPSLGLISNLTGQEVQTEVTEPSYWVRHVREAVRFAAGWQRSLSQECDVFLEVGPHPTLLGMGRQCLPGVERLVAAEPPVEARRLATNLGESGRALSAWDGDRLGGVRSRLFAPESGTADVPVRTQAILVPGGLADNPAREGDSCVR